MKRIKSNDDPGFHSVWEDFFRNDLCGFLWVIATGISVPAVNISASEKEYYMGLAAGD